MASDLDNRDLDNIRRALARRAMDRTDKLENPQDIAERIGRALLGDVPDTLSCETVQAQLPMYVDAELRGEPVARIYLDITDHLATCADCGPIHADLLDMETGSLPEPLPMPDLTALRRRRDFLLMRAFVENLAERLVAALKPDVSDDLRILADAFFEQVRELPARIWLRPPAAGILGFGGSEIPEATRWLSASYVATQQLKQTLAPERVATLQSQGRLATEISAVARAAALDSGLNKSQATRFANELAQLVLAEESGLPTWPGYTEAPDG